MNIPDLKIGDEISLPYGERLIIENEFQLNAMRHLLKYWSPETTSESVRAIFDAR